MRTTRVPILLLTASLVVAACQGATYRTSVTIYRVGPGTNQVTVSVDTDEPDQVPHVIVMRETSDVVQLRAELDGVDPGDPNVPRIGVGHTVEIVVNLNEPLGARTLLAETGNQVLLEPTFTS